jgi:hypothetical protein
LLVTPSFFSIVDDIEHFVGVAKRKLMRQKDSRLHWPEPANNHLPE